MAHAPSLILRPPVSEHPLLAYWDATAPLQLHSCLMGHLAEGIFELDTGLWDSSLPLGPTLSGLARDDEKVA